MKYNKITKEIEKELEGVLNFIINDLNINILVNWRSRLYPEYRSLLNIVAFRKHKVSPSEMARFYTKRGLKYSHDKYLHSVGKFDTYAFDLPELKNYLYLFFKDATPMDKEIVVIEKQYKYLQTKGQIEITPIQQLVSDLTVEETKELSEMIELRKKSWSWKSQDRCEIIESSNGLSNRAF
jgi:hypothetical protein